MTRSFSIPATPSVAQRLMRLKDLTSNVSVDSGIAKLAEQGSLETLLEQSDLTMIPKMEPDAERIIQELLDLDLRATIGVTRETPPERWLYPVLLAARLSGIDELAYDHSDGRLIKKAATLFGFRTIIRHKRYENLSEVSEVSRNALYIIDLKTLTTEPTTWAPTMEMRHTVVTGLELFTKRFRLHPGMPTAATSLKRVVEGLTSRPSFFFGYVSLDRQREN